MHQFIYVKRQTLHVLRSYLAAQEDKVTKEWFVFYFDDWMDQELY